MQSVKAGSQYDVVIAGGGYIGLSVALGLAREIGPDLRIAVVDRAAGPAQPPATEGADPRASAISAGSINLLRALGIWRQVEDAATPVTSIELTDSSLNAGVRRPLLTYDNVAADGEPASYILPNAELAVALERSVTACASITRVFSASVSGFQTDAGRSVVVFDDGRRFETEFAIAADGRRSGLREAAGIGTVGWDYDQTGIVTTITHDADHHNRAIQHFLPGGPFALLPLKGGHRSCITWSETATEAKRIMALDNAAFLEEVDVRVAGRLDTVKLDGPRKSWPLEAHLARSYIGTRLAVIGDAAHGVHPIGGQGLNLGFRDVAALIECIA
ncbi:MAG: FAD-dependent monooxygenase, partial [Hyphomicrobiaceae bacterium]